MDALNSGFWGLPPFINSHLPKNKNKNKKRNGKSSNSKSDSKDVTGGNGHRFPLKQALTASTLALTGDTIAQLRQRWIKIKTNHNLNNNDNAVSQDLLGEEESTNKDIMRNLLSDHDWLRALRMTSYGFLLYGPGSYAWYQYLDHCMPKKNVQNLLLKVLLNQVVLGPIVIGVVFAWNNLWLGKLSELPNKYQKDALPTLLFGFRFWIPVSLLNFWVVPLQARVAFMSTGSIFWNFCLSSTMSK